MFTSAPHFFLVVDQSVWLFRDNTGKSHHIGVYHGQRSGHLIVYCDGAILKIEFNVKPPYSYSFFVNDELCHIELSVGNAGTEYNLKIDQDIDTPINRARKAANRQINTRFIIALAIAVPVLLGLVIFGFTHKNRAANKRTEAVEYVRSQGNYTVAQVAKTSSFWKATFHNSYGPQEVLIYQLPWQDSLKRAEYPIQSGDTLFVRSHPDYPNTNLIDLDSLPSSQVDRLIPRVALLHQAQNPNLNPALATCEVQQAYLTLGAAGLSSLYRQQYADYKNQYHRLIRSEVFKGKVAKNCW